MSDRTVARINPATLVWAREVRGMPGEVAARRIGVSAARLAELEDGASQPTLNQLRSIGRVYRKPSAFFYTSELPPKPEQPRDFRRLPDADTGLSPELRDAIARSRQRREDALDLAVLLEQPRNAFGVVATIEAAPEDLADRIRARVGIGLNEQLTWREQYAALRNWTEGVEACGVLVSQFSDVDVSEARGFSIGDQPLPLVALNGKDSPRAKVFTLFHELTHISLGATGVCDLHDSGDDYRARIETFCNLVAAEVLVPRAAILGQDVVATHRGVEWDDDDIRELATRFSVSHEVILRRLLTFERTSQSFYRRKREEYRRRLETSESAGGFMPYFRRILRDNGSAFTALAVEAYRIDAITSIELSRLLGGMKLRHLENVEHALARRKG
ncbi:MAG: ImmA/IrrE family metallo-endopeptidase [Chthoniobacterales bacterium]|nr:ImmA/IrrE family metallo-endopeptidase [Gemmatimonadaceae bacterium]MBA3833118.1 ImmA/IrrE family metallo-endopeptidase [Chthoniobacterales bacterium]